MHFANFYGNIQIKLILTKRNHLKIFSSESTSDQIKSNLTGKILVSSTCVQQPSPQSKVATITEISLSLIVQFSIYFRTK